MHIRLDKNILMVIVSIILMFAAAASAADTNTQDHEPLVTSSVLLEQLK